MGKGKEESNIVKLVTPENKVLSTYSKAHIWLQIAPELGKRTGFHVKCCDWSRQPGSCLGLSPAGADGSRRSMPPMPAERHAVIPSICTAC